VLVVTRFVLDPVGVLTPICPIWHGGAGLASAAGLIGACPPV